AAAASRRRRSRCTRAASRTAPTPAPSSPAARPRAPTNSPSWSILSSRCSCHARPSTWTIRTIRTAGWISLLTKNMPYSTIIWDDDDDPHGNVQHIAEHDLTIDDVEAVLADPKSRGRSDSSDLPAVWGHVPDGRFIIVVFEQIDEDTIRVIT